MNQPMSRRQFTQSLGVLGFLAGPAALRGLAVDAAPEPGKPIDVAICLDVSGSMNGLINSAKTKLWDIVNELAKVKPAPQLRVALYSYGHTSYDPKTGWVRKEADLTNDLDLIYQKLFALTINGGEEYVARVCRDAIEQQKWSGEKNALRVIFVCGNEPASQDKQVALKDVAEKAVAKDIVINAIFCGNPNQPDARDWKEFAAMARGQFAAIDQDRGTVVVRTPMDDELNALSGKLSNTYVAYGSAEKRKELKDNQLRQDANAAQTPGAAAPRAQAKAGGLYRNDAWDLVDRMKNDKNFDVKKLKDEELPEEMKKMTPEEREAYIKKKMAEREAIQKKINELAAKRQQYINEQMKKNPSAADKAFDAAMRGALRRQAAAKGIEIPE